MLKRAIAISFLFICFLTCSTLAQNTAAIIGTSYDPPRIPEGALGQLVSFSVSGVGKQLSGRVNASQLPLPTTLAGISVAIDSENGLIPLLSIEPAGAGITIITAQIPYELRLQIPFHVVMIIEDGKVVGSTRFNLLENNIHILRTCDALFAERGGDCSSSLVYHLNGTLVTAENPAGPNEHLVMYAVGLGRPDAPVRTGVAAEGLNTVSRLRLDFVFGGNVRPRDIRRLSDAVTIKPDYAGLAPGLVGLYQINFRVPALPNQLPKCDELIKSNLTITVGLPPSDLRGGSFDGVGICVAQ
jgi:uncharacterized protein (TIGR03437 family)